MIKTYLFELLQVNSRVIIPDFGAFLLKEKPGGKMEVSFNDFLKFNDGLLANKIIKTENITKTEATKKIKEFIKEIEDKIKTGERYIIEKVGDFRKDDFGRIKFEPYTEEKVQEGKPVIEKEETKKEEVKDKTKDKEEAKDEKVTEAEEKKEEEKDIVKDGVKENVKAEAEEKEIVSTEKKKETTKEIKPEEKKEATLTGSPPAGKTGQEDIKLTEQKTAKVAKGIAKKAEEKKKEPVMADILEDSEMISTKTTKQQSSSTLIWVSGIVVVVAAVITWAVIDYDRIKGSFGGGGKEVAETPVEEVAPNEIVTEEMPEEEVVAAESIAEEKQAIEEKPEVVVEKIQEPVPEKAHVGSKYYVVAGSFKVENNAVNYHKRLVNEGYNAENLGLIQGFHIVSFDGFNNLQDAVKMLKMVKADQADAWVMKY